MRREKLMNRQTDVQDTRPRPFWQQYLLIMAVVTIIAILGALLLGNIRQISNLYFLSTLVLLIIAAIPIFFEVGSGLLEDAGLDYCVSVDGRYVFA